MADSDILTDCTPAPKQDVLALNVILGEPYLELFCDSVGLPLIRLPPIPNRTGEEPWSLRSDRVRAWIAEFVWERNFDTFNPCWHCSNCESKVGLYGNDGWENWVDVFEDEETAKRSVRFLYLPLDCTRLNEAEIERVVAKVRVNDGNLKIIYLDEVHRLTRRGLDEQLLKPPGDLRSHLDCFISLCSEERA